MTTQLILGDCLERLKELEDNSVHSIVTDPPYGLSFMGKKWDYDVPQVEVWKECLRVLKPGGHLLSFSSSRTYHRMTVNVEDAGFEIRDQLMWVYGSGFPKSHNLGKAVGDNEWEGWGTALKPAHEPIVLCRKPISEKTIAKNVLKWGTGGLNIDKSRVPCDDKSKFPEGDYSTDTPVGSIRPVNRTADKNPDGRFPANFIHDGSQGVLDLFPDTISSKRSPKHNKKTEHTNTYTPAQAEYGDHNTYGDKGSAARFFYCAKASKKERNAGCEDLPEVEWKLQGLSGSVAEDGVSNKNGQGTVRGKSKNHHPTVKPIALMSYLINLVTPPGGVVLDPFVGSGSTGCAAVQDGFNFVGIELNEEYLNIANKRIQHLHLL